MFQEIVSLIKYNYSTQSQCPQSQCLSGEANFLFAPELYSHVEAWTKLGDNAAGVDCTGQQQQHPSSLNSGFSYNFVLGFAASLGLHITSSQQAKLLKLHITKMVWEGLGASIMPMAFLRTQKITTLGTCMLSNFKVEKFSS